MGITELLAEHITRFIEQTGYITVFVAMLFESTFLPVPSEAVMPFAGFLIAEGKFSFVGVIGISTLASLIGSLLSYYLGYYGGKPLIGKFGKYLLIDKEELEWTERFFARHGNATVFICRFIPVVRHLISLPAGFARMKLLPFCLFTVVGACLWNSFLAVVGYVLRQNWALVMQYSKIIDIVIVLILGAMGVWYVVRHIRKRRKNIIPECEKSQA